MACTVCVFGRAILLYGNINVKTETLRGLLSLSAFALGLPVMPTSTFKDMTAGEKMAAAEDDVRALPSNRTVSGHDFTGEQQGARLPEYVDVFVCCVTSTNNVCIRFIEYDAQYNELLDEMAAHYNSCEAKAAGRLEEGELYATLQDGRWLRVLTLGECDGGKVECYFVDEGYNSFIAPQDLVELENRFAMVPMQAIHCRLDGLVDYAHCEGAVEVLSDVLLGKTLVAGIISREDPVTVVLFDTSGPEDVDLNVAVFERLMKARFPPKGCVGRCHLSHVGKDGLLGVQMKGPSLDLLYDLMWAVNEHCRSAPGILEVPAMSTLYACEFRVDGVFYRAMLASPDPLPSGEFKVRYVDYGDEGTAFLSEFRSLDGLGEFVSRLPFQALHCRLRGPTEDDGLPWSEEVSSLLLETIGTRPELFLKVTRPADDDDVALVELFRRQGSGRDLVSINSVLAEGLKQ